MNLFLAQTSCDRGPHATRCLDLPWHVEGPSTPQSIHRSEVSAIWPMPLDDIGRHIGGAQGVDQAHLQIRLLVGHKEIVL